MSSDSSAGNMGDTNEVLDEMDQNVAGWSRSLWSEFYGEIAARLLELGVEPKRVASSYVAKLFQAGVRTNQHFSLVCGSLAAEDLATSVSMSIVEARTLLHVAQPQAESCKLLYQNSNKKIDVSALPLKTPEALIDIARRIFELAIPSLNLRINNKEGPLYTSSDQFRNSMVLFVENLQVPMSKIPNMREALRICGPSTVLSENEEDLLVPMELSEPHQVYVDFAVNSLKAIAAVVPIPGGCEATRRMYIDPILVAAARIAGNVKIRLEQTVQNDKVVGDVDYLFQNMDVPPLTVCVTEGKHDQHDKGVVQNIVQLAALRDTRKREPGGFKVEEPVFGMATTFLTWQFIVLFGSTVHTSQIFVIALHNLEESVKLVISHAAAMLEHRSDLEKKEQG